MKEQRSQRKTGRKSRFFINLSTLLLSNTYKATWNVYWLQRQDHVESNLQMHWSLLQAADSSGVQPHYLNLPVKEASFSTVKMLFQLLSVLFTLNTTVKSSKKQQRVCEARHSKVNACQNSGSPAWITSRYGCSWLVCEMSSAEGFLLHLAHKICKNMREYIENMSERGKR